MNRRKQRKRSDGRTRSPLRADLPEASQRRAGDCAPYRHARGGIPDAGALAKNVFETVMSQPVLDIHTHLYDPAFRELLLWGIDDLLVYHYLVAEGFRYFDLPYDKFWTLPKTAQADL